MRKNRSKISLSKEEKDLIYSLKQDLKKMGTPRDEWARYIQQELNFRRSFNKQKDPLRKQSGVIGFFRKIWNKILGFFFKSAAKRFTQDADLLEEFEKYLENPYEISSEEQKLMEMLNPHVEFNDVDELGKGGSSFKKKDDSIIVDFDNEEEE
ncbi:MAG: hypothetical protein BAJALOKI1v1_290006 [Promethearchaeota archaeon]|nr:MAG: hypothetical protein BAJALOKI1v1_290006 [Candidatus Lokiarchaeota archaeon]